MIIKYFFLTGVIISVFLLCINPISDFDTGYHLKTGEFIIRNHYVPLHDIYSYTANGARWIAHYWLSDVILGLIFLISGINGLILSISMLSALTYFLVIKTTLLRTKNWILIPLLLTPFSMLTYELWVTRPQIFTYFFTSLLIYILELWRRSRKQSLLLIIPPLFLIWANAHAGIVLGIAILFLYVISEAIFGIKSNKEKGGAVVIFFSSVFCTLINPNGYLVLIYSSIIKDTVKLLGVAEWGSIINYAGSTEAKLFLAIMAALLYLTVKDIILNIKDPKSIDYISIGLSLGAIILPIISIRHVGYFPILTFPIFIEKIDSLILKRGYEVKTEGILKIASIVLLATTIILGFEKAINKMSINERILPVNAVNFISENKIEGPMFNDGAFGGYLIWKLWPRQYVFTDGRDDVYSGQIASDYVSIMQNKSGWEKLVNEKYKINYFILYYHDPLFDITGNLFFNLKKMGFELVHWDDASIVMLRNSPENKNIIEKFSYKIINPFIDPLKAPPEIRVQIVEEIKRAIQISPDSKVLKNFIQ